MKKKTQIRSITAACAVIIVCSAVIVYGFVSLVYKPQLTYKPQNQQTPLTEEQLSGDVKTIELMGKTYTASFSKSDFLEMRNITLYEYADGNGNFFTYSNLSNQLVGFSLQIDDKTPPPELNEQTIIQAKAVARSLLSQYVDPALYKDDIIDVQSSGGSISVVFVRTISDQYLTSDFVDIAMTNDFEIWFMNALEVGRYNNLQLPDTIDSLAEDALIAAVDERYGSDAEIDHYAYRGGYLTVHIEDDHQYMAGGGIHVWLKGSQTEGGVQAEPITIEINCPFQPAAS